MFCALYNPDSDTIESSEMLRDGVSIPELYRINRPDKTRAYIFYHVLNNTVPRWAMFIGKDERWGEVHEGSVPNQVKLAKVLLS